jgi:hypothetical protein
VFTKSSGFCSNSIGGRGIGPKTQCFKIKDRIPFKMNARAIWIKKSGFFLNAKNKAKSINGHSPKEVRRKKRMSKIEPLLPFKKKKQSSLPQKKNEKRPSISTNVNRNQKVNMGDFNIFIFFAAAKVGQL